jgi:hypothetical protein
MTSMMKWRNLSSIGPPTAMFGMPHECVHKRAESKTCAIRQSFSLPDYTR